MSDKNARNPEIYPQKDHLAPGDDPGEVLRRREAAEPPHAQEKAARVPEKDPPSPPE